MEEITVITTEIRNPVAWIESAPRQMLVETSVTRGISTGIAEVQKSIFSRIVDSHYFKALLISVGVGSAYILWRRNKARQATYEEIIDELEGASHSNALRRQHSSGNPIDAEYFYPAVPAGMNTRSRWYPDELGYVMRVCPEGARRLNPLIPHSGPVKYDSLEWTCVATRTSPENVRIRLTPVYPDSWFVELWKYLCAEQTAVKIPSAHGCRFTNQCKFGWVCSREILDGKELTHFVRCGEVEVVTLEEEERRAVLHTLDCAGAKVVPYGIGSVLRALNARKWRDHTTLPCAVIASWWSNTKEREIKSLLLSEWNSLTRPAQVLLALEDDRDDETKPAKPSGYVIGPEMATTPDKCPMRGEQNELAAIEYRVDTQRSTVATLPEWFFAELDGFVEMVFPDGGELEAFSVDDVLRAQDGPLQKMRNERARPFISTEKIYFKTKSMLKLDANSKSSAVRNVSPLDPGLNMLVGCINKAMSKGLLRRFGWYAPGMSLLDISTTICTVAEGQEVVCESDFSKMDAHKHAEMTITMLATLFVRAMPEKYEEIMEQLISEINAKATTSSGIPYAAAGTQLSGSGTTTTHNTIINKIISYLDFRRQGVPKVLAFENVGIFCGDDSVTRNGLSIIETAAELGYVITAELVPRGKPIKFCKRVYPGAFDGCTGSIQDPTSVLPKSHLSFSDPSQGVHQMAVNRWGGMRTLDPAVSLYTAIYLRLCIITGLTEDDTEEKYIVKEAKLEGDFMGWPQLPNADEEWEKITGLSMDQLLIWVNSITCWNDWMSGPPVLFVSSDEVKIRSVDPTNPYEQGYLCPDPDNPRPPPQHVTTGVEGAARREEIETTVAEIARRNKRFSRNTLRRLRREDRPPDEFVGMTIWNRNRRQP